MATLRTAPASRDELIRDLFAGGASDEDIATAVGVTAATVRQDRRYLGLLRRDTPAEPVPDARLVELHAAGLDNAALVTATGLTRRTVRERLHRLGLRSHPTEAQRRARFGGR